MIQVKTKQPKSVGYQKQLKSWSCSLARRVNTIGRLESARNKPKIPHSILGVSLLPVANTITPSRDGPPGVPLQKEPVLLHYTVLSDSTCIICEMNSL